jgi:peptidoglycan/LPS O-acetylase OafA/YrhL
VLAVVAFAAAIAICSRVRVRVLELPPLIFLGTISYALYLVHQNIGYIVIREAQERGLSPLESIGAASAVAILIATVITFAIERPANRAVRGLLKRPTRKPPAGMRASES